MSADSLFVKLQPNWSALLQTQKAFSGKMKFTVPLHLLLEGEKFEVKIKCW